MDSEENGIKRLKVRRPRLYRWMLTEIEREIDLHPGYADLRNQIGLLLMVGGETKKAENHLLEALRLNPKYLEATLNLAFLYVEMERWEEAEEILLLEVKRRPRDAFLYHLIGILYLQTGRLKQAAAQIDKAIQSHSYYRDYYSKKRVWHKGVVHLNPKAERAAKKIHWKNTQAQFHNLIGLHLAKKRRFTQAVQELRKAARLKPDEFVFHANLGTVYAYQGIYPKAIQEFQKALKIDPFYGMGYANLSYLYGLMCRTREALQCMKTAVRINPQYADLHYNLALLYSDRRRYDEAAFELKKALRINPGYLFARINLGVLYEDQERWKEARREYRKILRITPEDQHIRKRLDRIS